MANKKQKMVTKEEFLKNRKWYTTEVTVTVKCRVYQDAASEKEAIAWAKHYVGRDLGDLGDKCYTPKLDCKVIGKRKMTKAERDEVLAAEGYSD